MSILGLPEAQAVLASTFHDRFGREPNIVETGIARNTYLENAEIPAMNSTDIVSLMMKELIAYLARSIAITLMANPTLNFARPVRLGIGTPTPTADLKIFPAAFYQRREDQARDVYTLYIMGMQPKFVKRIPHARYAKKWVLSHGVQVGWATVTNPQFSEFWPHGACWITSVYSEDVFAEIDDPLKPTKEFGRTGITDIGWKDNYVWPLK